MEIRCYRITGIVQGVGFRPFIHNLACKYQLKGWILNDSDGVLMEAEGESKMLDSFVGEIESSPPPMAKIINIIQKPCDTKIGFYTGFEIRKSRSLGKIDTLIPPDANVCQYCFEELFEESNRRFRYPFINCTNCGPRYSIIQDMPYDRVKTTMKYFEMCPECNKEYNDVNNRRYHAQPNACPICGPGLELTNYKGDIIEVTDIINFCREKLLEGKIIAVKSIGGFHLAVNAQDGRAVQRLRKRKKRDLKPFAIMVKNVETAQRFTFVRPEEKELLESVQRPIVLLKKKEGTLPGSIAPNNPSFGVMLPSAPLHHLLLESDSLPVLIMTSGNISEHPVVYKNSDALQQLSVIADYFILNNRDIHIRVDDSIVRCTNYGPLKKTIISPIRRSRGFAPYPVTVHRNIKPVLALGSEQKSTIALSKDNQIFISQHIGDIKNDETFKSLIDCSAHLQKLLSIKPQLAACDSHPAFRSTAFFLKQKEIPVTLVQHHHAHMASCMAENKLDNKAIGVIFDGNGHGLDGTVWGGEFLIGDYCQFERAGSLLPFYLLGGDKAVKEPFRVAIDLLYRTYGRAFKEYPLAFLSKLTPQELNVFTGMAENKINSFRTSSMGRLFDGVSAIINICSRIEYEAQAAIELESLLNKRFDIAEAFQYQIAEKNDLYEIDYRPMIKEIIDCVRGKRCDAAGISRRFHATIVDITGQMCLKLREKYSLNDIVLSGGVFMNEYLLVNTIILLRKFHFNVFYHSLVPTNDGGISLGQIMIAAAKNII